MSIHRLLIGSALSIACALSTVQANAHRQWILPETTVVSGESPWIPVSGAVSNDLFYANHYPLVIERIKLITPDGSEGELKNASNGKYRSTFDINLTSPGTYKIQAAQAGMFARWKDADGKDKYWPPRGQPYNPADFDSAVPKDAKDLKVAQSSNRIETWVSAGDTTDTVLKPTNIGLELIPDSHPNDLFSGETTNFKLLIDGKPAVGAEVILIRGATRYRNAQDEVSFKTDKKGHFSITWKKPGMYWLNASYQDNKAKAPATVRMGSYTATLEVLPE